MDKALAKLEQARDAGRRCQLRHVSLSGRQQLHPAACCRPPRWKAAIDALVARLAQPEFREQLQLYLEGRIATGVPPSKVSLIGWENVRISGVSNPGLKCSRGPEHGSGGRRPGHHTLRAAGASYPGRSGPDQHRDVPAGREGPARGLHPPAAHGRFGRLAAARAPSRIPAPMEPFRASPGGCGATRTGLRWKTRCCRMTSVAARALWPGGPRPDTARHGRRSGAVRRRYRRSRHLRLSDPVADGHRACLGGGRGRRGKRANRPAGCPAGFWR